MRRYVYLDNNATARILPEVIQLQGEIMSEVGNASSVHGPGRKARHRVEEARREVAALAGASEEQVVFTSGGTEANNQVMRVADPDRTLVSAIEHPAVLEACPGASRIPVDGHGVIDLPELERALEEAGGPCQVAVMLANNETGVIQPVEEAARICHRFGARIHCDAVQAAGKIPIDFKVLGVDTLAMTAHKLGGPQGVGALVVRSPDIVDCQILGGGQERGLRGGTEAVAQLAAFGLAARLARERLSRYGALEGLRDRLEAELSALTPGFRVFGKESPRLPNTSKVMMPGVRSETLVMAFDLEGVAVSAGSACSSGRVEPPYVLQAMGVPDDDAACALRVSLGWDTEAQDIERFVEVWKQVLRRRAVAGSAVA